LAEKKKEERSTEKNSKKNVLIFDLFLINTCTTVYQFIYCTGTHIPRMEMPVYLPVSENMFLKNKKLLIKGGKLI